MKKYKRNKMMALLMVMTMLFTFIPPVFAEGTPIQEHLEPNTQENELPEDYDQAKIDAINNNGAFIIPRENEADEMQASESIEAEASSALSATSTHSTSVTASEFRTDRLGTVLLCDNTTQQNRPLGEPNQGNWSKSNDRKFG